MVQMEERSLALSFVAAAAVLQKAIGTSGMISVLSDPRMPTKTNDATINRFFRERGHLNVLLQDLLLRASELDSETFLTVCWLSANGYFGGFWNNVKVPLFHRIAKDIVDFPIVYEISAGNVFSHEACGLGRAQEDLVVFEYGLRRSLAAAKEHGGNLESHALMRHFPPCGREQVDQVFYGQSLFLVLLARANVLSTEDALSKIIVFPFHKVWKDKDPTLDYKNVFSRHDGQGDWEQKWRALWAVLTALLDPIRKTYRKGVHGKRSLNSKAEQLATLFSASSDHASELFRFTLALACVERFAERVITANTFNKEIASLGFANVSTIADLVVACSEDPYGQLALQRMLAWEDGLPILLDAMGWEMSQSTRQNAGNNSRRALNIIIDAWINARREEVGTRYALLQCNQALQEIFWKIDDKEARQRAFDWLRVFQEAVDARETIMLYAFHAARALAPKIHGLGEVQTIVASISQHLAFEELGREKAASQGYAL